MRRPTQELNPEPLAEAAEELESGFKSSKTGGNRKGIRHQFYLGERLIMSTLESPRYLED